MRLTLAACVVVLWAAPAQSGGPPAAALRCLPPYDHCKKCWEVAYEEYAHWDRLRGTWAADAAKYGVACERLSLWACAAMAADPQRTLENRLGWLKELTERVGWRVVLTGELPPPVPLEWLREKR